MKTLRFLFSPIWLLFLLPAYSQDKGIAEGQLLNRTNPSIVASGVELEVLGLSEGMSIIKTSATDPLGKFRIEGLPVNQPLMIRANYKGANYHSPLKFDNSGIAHVEIEIYESTDSMKDILVEAVQMAFQMDGDRLKSLETYTFNNRTNPPKTFMNPEGNFRISKSPGILEPPKIRATSPGSTMPLVQSALESADGKSYYSQYPLRPGKTIIEVQQELPYANRNYTFAKKFYQNTGSIDVIVFPQDLVLSGKDLLKLQTDSQRNFAVYRTPSMKAGTELTWSFSGGTPVAQTQSSETPGDSTVEAKPDDIAQKALIIGPLVLMGFILVLWLAWNKSQNKSAEALESPVRQMKDRREQLLNSIADLDHRYENHSIGQKDYLKQREEGKRWLRRIYLLLKKP